jgi:hypothetical protein
MKTDAELYEIALSKGGKTTAEEIMKEYPESRKGNWHLPATVGLELIAELLRHEKREQAWGIFDYFVSLGMFKMDRWEPITIILNHTNIAVAIDDIFNSYFIAQE